MQFDYFASSYQQLSSLSQIEQQSQASYQQINYNKLNKIINLHQKQVVQSLGALILHLLDYEIIDTKFRIQASINKQSLYLNVPKSTYQYLQLMKQYIHPSFAKGKGRSKEGFTVFNLYASATITSIGLKHMENIFMKPLLNKEAIQRRQNIVQFFHLNFKQQYKLINHILKNIKNIKVTLQKCRSSRMNKDDWKRLYFTIQNIIKLQQLIVTATGSYSQQSIPEFILDLCSLSNLSSLKQIFFSINQTFTISQVDVKVNKNINAHLDKLEKRSQSLDIQLMYLSEKYSHKFATKIEIIFVSQIGYLIFSNKELTYEGWAFEFRNYDGYYYSNQLVKELDQEYGDILAEIKDIKEFILIEMGNYIKENEDKINQLYELVGEFDSLLAVAKISQNFVKPIITDDILIIKNGWHILLDSDKTVFNHTFSYPFDQNNKNKEKIFNNDQNFVNSNYTNRCLLISGSNGSGKSIYVKQIGIILFLAHIGSYVPAELCTVPLVDAIICFNPVHSNFKMKRGTGGNQQLAEINQILTNVTRRSFVVIDQFGHSCSYFNAEKIIYSLLQYFTRYQFPQNRLWQENKIKNKQLQNNKMRKQSDQCNHQPDFKTSSQLKIPFSIIITHMKDLFNKDLQYNRHLRHLQTLITFQNKQINYLYKIVPGCYEGNHAIDVCRSLEFDSKFIQISQRIKQQILGQRMKEKALYQKQELKQKIRKVLENRLSQGNVQQPKEEQNNFNAFEHEGKNEHVQKQSIHEIESLFETIEIEKI